MDILLSCTHARVGYSSADRRIMWNKFELRLSLGDHTGFAPASTGFAPASQLGLLYEYYIGGELYMSCECK